MDCFHAALKRSEVLADQEEQIVQAEEHYHQAFGSVLPQVNLAGVYLHRDPGSSTNLADQGLVTLNATEPLFRGLREYAALRQTKDLITYQQESKQWAGLQLYSDTAQAFYTVLALEKDLSHIVTQIDVYQQRIVELNGFIRIGRSRPNEVLTVQSAQAILKAQKVQVEGQVFVAREVLAFVTGLSQDIALNDVNPAPAAVDALDAYLALLDKRPDLVAARKKIEAINENITIARGARLPSVDVAANYYLASPVNAASRWDAGVALTMPLFTGGIISSKISEAESQVRQTELAWQRLQRLDTEILRNAYHDFQADLAQAIALAEAAVLAHKDYQAEQRDYKNGLVTNLDVLQSLTADQDTKRSLDKIRFALQIDYQNLEAAAAKITF
jgi:outer membrane protein